MGAHVDQRALLLRVHGQFLLMFFLKIGSVLLSNTHCLNKSLECIFFQNILHLVHIMLVHPVPAAVCERGFSAKNRIKSDTRVSLHSDTVEDLIRISVEGPSLEDFDARECGKLV